MEVITYSAFRANLGKKLKEVCENHLGIIITQRKADPVVVMSLEDHEKNNILS